MPEAEEFDVAQALLAWCDIAGIQRKGLDVRMRPGAGRCLQAAQSFEDESCLLLVPAEAIIAEGVHDRNYEASHWMLGVAHRLLEEDALGTSSAYAPYVQLLLDGGDAPQDFGPFLGLPGTAGSLAKGRQELRAAQVAELCSSLPSCRPDRAASALHAVDSRTVYSHEARVRALVPFFDFLNHSAKPNARWEMGKDRVLKLFATRSISAEEEVTITYDSIANARLLVTYGFVLDGDGPHRLVDLSLAPPAWTSAGVQLEVLGNGSLRRRGALLPLFTDKELISEAAVAQHVLQEARGELRQWQLLQDMTPDDPRVLLLSAMSVEVLRKFSERIASWLEGPQDTSLLVALGPPAEAVEVGSTSDSEEAHDD